MARWRCLVSAALAASSISSVAMAQAEDQDEEGQDENAMSVSIDDLPADVQDAILKHVENGELREVVEETGQNGEPKYEARIRRGKRRYFVWVDETGKVLAVDRGE